MAIFKIGNGNGGMREWGNVGMREWGNADPLYCNYSDESVGVHGFFINNNIIIK
jgi:hypothetical protein